MNVVRALWDAWANRDTDALFELYDPEIEWDQSGYPAADVGGVCHGHEGVRRFFRDWLASFDGYYARADEFIDAGEAVVVSIRQGATGKDSGVEVEMRPYWQVFRLRDGLVVRVEPYADEVEAFAAVGGRTSRTTTD